MKKKKEHLDEDFSEYFDEVSQELTIIAFMQDIGNYEWSDEEKQFYVSDKSLPCFTYDQAKVLYKTSTEHQNSNLFKDLYLYNGKNRIRTR